MTSALSVDATQSPVDGLTTLDGMPFYRISDCDLMPAFLVSVVSDTDLWMYVSSRGGLTAGRVNEDQALFPYETEDRLHHAGGITGPVTLLRVGIGKEAMLWEPFSSAPKNEGIRRHLYLNLACNQIVFEEEHEPLGLTFRYRWSGCEELGWVRTAYLINDSPKPMRVSVVDGLLNLLPAGLPMLTQQTLSCLSDAYKRCEVDEATGLGIFSMASLMTDRAEPAEALRATAVWSRGLENASVLLSTDQLDAFRAGATPKRESALKGRRGSYLVTSEMTLPAGATQRWDIVADVSRTQAQVEALRSMLESEGSMEAKIDADIAAAHEGLVRNVASADGLQLSQDRIATAHHFANVLFNNMRGGVFIDDHRIPAHDFADFVAQRNREVHQQHANFLSSLNGTLQRHELLSELQKCGDANLLRLGYEYLPLTFSRRHGDPSRPWNRFTVRVKNQDGTRVLDYQGNWRDIFQNWEALCMSFPGFIESIIAKFVNASTADGFNPYRVTRQGIEWETLDLGNPWSNIGYWGDHQIVYLLRLLEASQRYHPGELGRLLSKNIFTYANVPYRIKPYVDMLQDNRNTILFDAELDDAISKRTAAMGSDGKLLADGRGQIIHVNLAEKLLVPLLSKLSNFVPDGGIWMNTQRPEWNDANNALVGNGVSMVTLCHLRRYVAFNLTLFEQANGDSGSRDLLISSRVIRWLDDIARVLANHVGLLTQPTLSDEDRRVMLDALGHAFDAYRHEVYTDGLGAAEALPRQRVVNLLRTALTYLDHGISANRREDGLYHAYNLLVADPQGTTAGVKHLHEMLEGQVAALSSGMIAPRQVLSLLNALRSSRMYREDQSSYMLYPDRALPGFLEKNRLTARAVADNALLSALLAAGDQSIVVRDMTGCHRFAADFRNQRDLSAALDALATQPRWAELVATHRRSVSDLYEQVFNHHEFTGRSGAMYSYEGLGSIYWHMVAKLLLAVQECFFTAADQGEKPELLRDLAQAYYEVRRGLGFNKTARRYGAFPLIPYSHTPIHGGARQPGMTGQVKEEIITRQGELGLLVRDGCLTFQPRLLRRSEFLNQPTTWDCRALGGEAQVIELPEGSLGFTCCRTPMIYRIGDESRISVYRPKAGREFIRGNVLDLSSSTALFARRDEIQRIDVEIPAAVLLLP